MKCEACKQNYDGTTWHFGSISGCKRCADKWFKENVLSMH